MFGWFKKTQDESYLSAPIGLEEFNDWTKEVIQLTRLPFNESMRFAIATIVLESREILSKKEAAERLVKAAQNQIASFVFQDIKSKRMAADALEKQQAEAIAALKEFEKQEAPEVNAEGSESGQEPIQETPKDMVPSA